eukprot:5682043-Prorocentrum_lima.AAC.1
MGIAGVICADPIPTPFSKALPTPSPNHSPCRPILAPSCAQAFGAEKTARPERACDKSYLQRVQG